MIRKLLTFLFLCVAAQTAVRAQSQVYVDVLAGHRGLTSEFFFLEPIDPKGKWNIISRSELHLTEYDRNHPSFVNYNFFSYTVKNHFGIVAGTYASSHYPFSARLGFQYLKENEEWLVYANVSSAVTSDPDAQLLLVLGYLPKITEKWRFVSRLEARTAINYQHGHAFSTQQLKLGAQYNEKIGFGVGVEAETEEEHDHTQTHFNIGPFVRVNF
jgi:hypothetical protein